MSEIGGATPLPGGTIRGGMRRFSWFALAVLLLAALLLSGCGDDDSAPTSLVVSGVILGEGVVPPAIPSDFPRPANAVIGSTIIDTNNHRTEMNVRMAVPLVTFVQFYNVGLINQGYVITASSGSSERWTIEFMRGELLGSIIFSPFGDLTQAVVTVNAT